MAEPDLLQALSDTIQRTVNLRVVTVMGEAILTGTLDRLQVAAPTAPAGSIVTEINLAAGDITHIVSDKLLGAEFADLRNAHQQAVTQAQTIIERNAKLLVEIVKEIGEQLHALPPPTPGPARPGGG